MPGVLYFIVYLVAGLSILPADISALNEICCPMAWLGFGGHCYRYFTHKLNFNDARTHCQELKADLVSIHSSIENDIINGLTAGNEIWLGLTDLLTESSFEWVDGTPFSYTNWNSDQPNGENHNQDCAGMSYRDHADGYWHDYQCDGEFQYVCKM